MCWIMGPILTVHVNQVLWRVQCKFVFCYCEHGRSTQDPSGISEEGMVGRVNILRTLKSGAGYESLVLNRG